MWVSGSLLLCGRCLRPVPVVFRETSSRSSCPVVLTTAPKAFYTKGCVQKQRIYAASAFSRDILRSRKRVVYDTGVCALSDKSKRPIDDDDLGPSKTTFHRVVKWGLMTVLATASVSITVVWWEIQMLKHRMAAVTATFDPKVEEEILTETQENLIEECLITGDCGILENPVKMWFPWMQSKSQDPFVLLDLCRSDRPSIRQMGITALAEKTLWEDYQYRYIAQAADYRTLIGLCRTQGADNRFFLPQPKLATSEKAAVEELASVLLLMEEQERNNNSSKKLRKNRRSDISAAARALELIQQKQRPSDDDKRTFWGFEGSSVDVVSVDGPLPEDQLELEFLAAVSKLCIISEQALLFVKKNGLAVLQRLTEQFKSTETFTAVANVLGNLALHPGVHEDIVSTGWLGVLKGWSESRNSQLAATAARVLMNLDTDFSSETLENGVLILHPLSRTTKNFHADIIFVHGLLGGAIRTWRQLDRVPLPDGDKNQRTDCWPRDWLAEDCPHVRIISIHYDTALSSWATCDNDKSRCTLEGRGRELLGKLRRAGVGERPIIWVGHSMGGLLIKQMLDLADAGLYMPVKDLTCGILLYAVPHRGLSLAALTSQIHYILYPSIEVQELRKDSAHLARIHAHFKEFIDTNGIPCLSFGETLRTRFRKTLPKMLLVPEDSSDPGVGEFMTMPLDHISICKPETRNSTLYQKSLGFIHQALIFSYLHRLKKAVTKTLNEHME